MRLWGWWRPAADPVPEAEPDPSPARTLEDVARRVSHMAALVRGQADAVLTQAGGHRHAG